MKTAIIRGKYLNKFEMQNYEPIAKKAGITAFASLKPLHGDFKLPVKKVFSPMDLPNFPKKMPILNRIFTDALYLPGLEPMLKGFDIVHVRETYFRITQQGIAAKKKGYVKKVLCTCSETIPFNHEGIRGRKAFKKNAHKNVDLFHCLTERAQDCLLKEGVKKDKIRVVGYGINLKRFRPDKGLRKDASMVNLLFVGRLVPEKCINELVDIFEILKKNFRKISLTIVGFGPLEKILKKKIQDKPMLRLAQIVKRDYAMMPLEYNKADIFIFPSCRTKHWEEYYGMALLEAMASGLPVVSTDSGAIPEVSGGNALIGPQKNAQALYDNIKSLISSESLRREYGNKAYTWAKKNFDAEKQAEKLYSLYEEVLLRK